MRYTLCKVGTEKDYDVKQGKTMKIRTRRSPDVELKCVGVDLYDEQHFFKFFVITVKLGNTRLHN